MAGITGFNAFIKNALKYGFSLFGLPKTGQTIIYKDGDDGFYQKGYPKSGPRFKDNGDGTITDLATGLMWVQDGNGEGCNFGEGLVWEDAIDFCEQLEFAGYSDWRLPNIHELHSIIDVSVFSPSIDPIFINTKSDYYWASTTCSEDALDAKMVTFEKSMTYVDTKDREHYVRPVRGGV